jgi:succinoglycan biosynthesis transport protein ExoP
MSNHSAAPPAAFPHERPRDAAPIGISVRAARKHWPTLLACIALCTAGGFTVGKSLTKVYQASALLEINPHIAQPLGNKDDDSYALSMGLFVDSQEYYETQYKIIQSDRVLTRVVQDMGLTNDLDFMGYASQPPRAITVQDAVRVLRRRLVVEPVKASRLAYIRAEDTSPKRAHDLADAISQSYLDQNLQAAVDSSSSAVVWLSGQLDHVKHDLESDEQGLYHFKEENQLPSTSLNETSNMLRLEMQELDTALTQIRTKRAELESRQAELAKLDPTSDSQLAATELLSNPFLQSLRAQYAHALDTRNSLLAAGKDVNHPEVKQAQAQLDVAEKMVLDQIRDIHGSVQRDLDSVKRQEATEQSLFESSRRRAVELNMKEIEFHRLDRTRQQDEQLYELLLRKLKEADLSRMMRVNNIRIVDSAVEPIAPIRPRVELLTLGGFVIGLLLGAGLTWLRELLDNTLKTPDEIEDLLGVGFLGLLPEDAPAAAPRGRRRSKRQPKPEVRGKSELLVHEQPTSSFAEAARAVRTNLTFMTPDKPIRTILVTSAAPSEGKTTTACSIAIALAQAGQRVCIVDCDLRRPRLHRIFDRAGDMGVTNVLVGEAEVTEVAKPTVVGNLYSIPTGPLPPNPADILHSERFKRFLTDLATHFDRVVIDSPPLIAVTDPAILSTLVDGTVVVIRSFHTARQLAQQGLRALRDVDSVVLGVVLNAVNLKKYQYSYYRYYYQYSYYGQNGAGTVSTETPTDTPASPPS